MATLVELWARQVAATPDAVAVIAGADRVTYAELDRRAGALAGRLRARGVGPESLVGIWLERSVDQVVALLGVLKAGGAYVPLDPTYPAERLRHMVEDSGVRLAIADEATALLPAGLTSVPPQCPEGPLQDVQRLEGVLQGMPADAEPGNLAYLIYTSGSTGRPKGVAVTHASISAFLETMAVEPGLTAADRVLGLTPLSFDISTLETFLPLTVGACVVLAPPGANTDPKAIAATLAEHGVTVVQATPTTWRMLVEADWPGADHLTLLTGGEPLDPVLAKELLDRGGSVWNMYGPTETTVWSTVSRVTGDRVDVGRAVRGEQVYVVGEDGRQVKPGTVGELWIGGVGLARGYHDRPGLTADRFVPDPWGTPGGRLYRTGDLARVLPDGAIEVLGRVDQQVKVRGFRIELGEIESVLRRNPLVADCLVGVDEAGTGLVAYTVLKERPDGWPAALRDHAATRLPAHMVPQGYAALAALPRTPAGKADRKALADVPYERIRTRQADPVSPRAELIAGVWRDVLGVPDLSAHDDFFAMGGQSLSAVRSVARLRDVLGVPVDVTAIFAARTAVELDRRLADDGDLEPIPVGRSTGVRSFGQERIWLFEQLDTGVPLYNLPVALSFPDGHADAAALSRALTEIARRHEVLRSGAVAVPVVEVADLDAELTARVREPFDLDGPLLRAVLLRSADRDLLLVTIHHIACDGWSVDVLVRELGTLYAGGSLPPLPLQYSDFAAWQRERLSGAELDRRLAYWRERLAGAPALELPTDLPRPAVATHRGARELFRVPASLADRLRELCRANGVTLFMGLLAPLQVLLGRYAGQTDVPVGTLVGGRDRAETENLIGYFVNTVVLRTDLSDDPLWTELLARVRDVALGAYAHQDVPFERLVDALAPARDLSRNPLFQVLFAMHEAVAGPLPEPISRRDLEGRLGGARFDLAFDITDLGDDLEVSIEYATDLFEQATARRLGRHFVRVVEQLVTDPSARLSTVEVLAPDEIEELLGGEVAEVEPTTLVELWRRQVAATPGAVALDAGSERLTFAEVDRRASALAAALRDKGVGPESRVGVCLHRSPDLIVALLGVLLAGGAYVPLDPDYPADRLSYLVADSGVRLVIADPTTASLLPASVTPVPAQCPEGPLQDVERLEGVLQGLRPEHLAYVIHTSGSTGQPKGVAITHANITSFLAWNQRVCRLSTQDRTLLNHSVAFDNSVWEIFQCLTSGAQLHLADATTAYDPEAFLAAIARRGITTLNATPSQLRVLLDTAGDRAFESVRLVFTGAEAVPHDVARRILAATGPDCQVFNEYGPTEATVTSAYCPITADLLARHAHQPSVPFGRTTDNARLYVLDEHLRPVVPGCRGILHVGGPAVGRGYLGKPAKTAAAYLPDPFSAEPGARMYATGDVVRLLPDGNLVFLGRDDHQVKLRGYRIELGEIESVLRAHPTVSGAVVAVRREQLAAYVVLTGDAGDLREHVARELPAYLVPQSVTVIDEIPLTPNGKVDRDALPDPVATHTAGRAPATDRERLVARVWQECLQVAEIGADDDFFDAGGNSLAVTGVARRLSAELGRKVSPVLIFQHPTVAELAEALGQE
jgi:amino acid adenylation domain-containing protein